MEIFWHPMQKFYFYEIFINEINVIKAQMLHRLYFEFLVDDRNGISPKPKLNTETTETMV